MKPHDRAPNGVFCDGLILYGSLERGAIAAKGFWLEPPDSRGASIARLNAQQDQLRGLLALITVLVLLQATPVLGWMVP